MVALVLEGLLVVLQHLPIFFGSHAIQTLLVVLVCADGAFIADVLKGSVESSLRSDKSHEVLDWAKWARGHVEPVVPESITSQFVILFIFLLLLLSSGCGLFLLLLTGVPEVSVEGGETYEDSWAPELDKVICTGPSLRTARAKCSKRKPGCLTFIIPLSSALNFKLHFLRITIHTSRFLRNRSRHGWRTYTTYMLKI